jgi:hypothetical protein
MQRQTITLSRVAISPQSDRQFLEDFQVVFADYLDIVSPQVIPRQEWIDCIPSEQPDRQNQPCLRWANLEICCTGEVALCCMDGRCAYPLGDVRDHTILEIYNQPAYRRLRT